MAKRPNYSFDSLAEDTATEMATGQTERQHDDPIILAEQHLVKCADSEGEYTYAHFLADTYGFDKEEGWRSVKPGELDVWVRETIQATFDKYAQALSSLKGQLVRPKPVGQAIVSNTILAMASLVKREVPFSWQSPFWLQPYEDWNADDVLCFHNGILNVRRYIEDRGPYFIPLTVKLFYEHQADFNFPTLPPPEATEWRRFLDSLEQDESWEKCLQEIMGYCLWLGYDLQKFFMFIGPPRAGKGLIAKIIKNLVGGPLAACAPELTDFAAPFGLEDAIGTRLAVVPEVRMPERGVHNVVDRLKSITGGDTIPVNRKHIKKISIHLRIKIIMLSNLFVPLPDNSGALHGRLIPLKLTKSFLGKEDTKLAEKLKPEYPAILLWALEGLKRLWQADGRFTLPQSTRDMQEQLLAASAPLQLFLEECCDVDSRMGVHTVALYQIYREWLSETHPGEEPISEREFPNELRAAAPMVTKKRAKKANERPYEGRTIVKTQHDAKPHTRAWMWLGICPKPNRRGEVAGEVDSDDSNDSDDAPPVGVPAITLPVDIFDGGSTMVCDS